MAKITLEGVKINTMSIARDAETGAPVLQGEYALMASNGNVLAKQGFNGYNSVKIAPSPATSKLLIDLQASVQSDINTSLGF